MKHALIIGHPRKRSFTQLLAATYLEAIQAAGHQAVVRDLYAIGFDPRLAEDELPWASGNKPRADATAERTLLADVDVFAFFYPIWFGSPPAIVKGYVERVFGAGFGYESVKGGGMRPRLTGRKMISFTSTGSENTWMVSSGSWDAVRKIFNERLTAACGLTSIEHINFGGVDPDIRRERLDEAVEAVKDAVLELFPSPTDELRESRP